MTAIERVLFDPRMLPGAGIRLSCTKLPLVQRISNATQRDGAINGDVANADR